MTLDEAIIQFKEDAEYNKADLDLSFAEDNEQVAAWLEELKAYKNAEEQGLLLKLPCKVGDTVYTACAWGIESGIVGSIEVISDRIFVNNMHGAMIGEAHNVFSARDEAEEKFKQLNNKNV